MSQIIYPCIVIDVGFNKLPKFDKMSIEELVDSKLDIEQFAFFIVEHEHSELDDDDDIKMIEAKSIQIKKELFNFLKKLLKNCGTLISHNIETDLKVLDAVHRKLFDTPFNEIKGVNTFCTMLEGLPYSTCHVYRGGEKVKKYPTLQQLYKNLTGEDIHKGDIFDDVETCFDCFRALENKN